MMMIWIRKILKNNFVKGCKLFGLILIVAFQVQAQAEEAQGRALFVSVIQNPPVLTARDDIAKLVQFSKKNKIQVLFVQIYRSGQAWFPSQYADRTPFEKSLKSVGEDPLALLIQQAHAEGIEVHAWLNLLTLNENANAPILKKYGPDILTQKPGAEKKGIEDYKIDNQYFLEPGDLRVRDELKQMIVEVVQTYPALDGIQLDYIRYPDAEPFYGYTPNNIMRFKQAKGESSAVEESNLDWKNWRRDQVTELVRLLREHVLSINPKLQFSTTGCAPYIRALEEAFQDWPKWQKEGVADFVTVMTYPKTVTEFEKQIDGLKKRNVDFSKLNIAIGSYKLLDQPEIFSEQFKVCEKSGARACVVFHYGNFLESPKLIKALQASRWTKIKRFFKRLF